MIGSRPNPPSRRPGSRPGASRRAARAVTAWLPLLLVAGAPVLAPARAQPAFAEVAAIFDERCVVCHSGDAPPLGLRLDTHAAVLDGSVNGPVVVPGNPEASELVHRIRGTRLPRMPLTGPPFLSDEEIERIAAWIAAGANPDAAEADAPAAGDAAPEEDGPAVGESAAVADAPSGDDGEAAAEPPAETPAAADGPPTFDRIEPILLQRCVSCHSDGGVLGRPPEGLRLDTYEAVLNGSDRVVVVPGAPAASELMRRITGRSLPRMPFDGPPYLDEEQIGRIRDWIAAGAPNADGVRAPVPVGAEVRLQGTLTARWRLDDLPLHVSGPTRIEEEVAPGAYVEVRGIVREDGSVRVERIRTR